LIAKSFWQSPLVVVWYYDLLLMMNPASLGSGNDKEAFLDYKVDGIADGWVKVSSEIWNAMPIPLADGKSLR